MTLGERIKEARLKKRMTQEELAKLLGYKSRSSINKIEVDGRDVPRSMIVRFAEILDVTPSYLMGWDDESSVNLDNPDTLKFIKLFESLSKDKQQLVIGIIEGFLDKE